MHIDRCYCFGVLFSTIREIAEATGAETVEEAQSKILFGRQCELCHAYVRRSLETGQDVFHEIIRPD
jgi:bacterioferritin-associated ferredoxin